MNKARAKVTNKVTFVICSVSFRRGTTAIKLKLTKINSEIDYSVNEDV